MSFYEKGQFFSFVWLLTLSGCANNVWIHPSKNNAQFNQDKSDCLVQANNLNPNMPQPASPPPAYTTNCYGSGNMASCTTTPQVQPNYAAIGQAIALKRAREDYFSSCMQARGWMLQSAETVATMQGQHKDRVEQYQAAIKDLDEQRARLCVEAQYAAFFAKSSCKATTSTLAELSDTSRATKAQKEAILKLDLALKEISKRREEIYRQFMTPQSLVDESVALNQKVQSRTQKLRLELYNGRITWGQYNTEIDKVSEDANSEFREITKKYAG